MGTPKIKPTNESDLKPVGRDESKTPEPHSDAGTRSGSATDDKLFPDSTGEASQAGRSDAINNDTE